MEMLSSVLFFWQKLCPLVKIVLQVGHYDITVDLWYIWTSGIWNVLPDTWGINLKADLFQPVWRKKSWFFLVNYFLSAGEELLE